MGLRNILLIISCVMVGLCLSLYFQSGPDIQSMNWEQYKNLQYNEDITQSVEDFNKKIVPYKLEDLIQTVYDKNRMAGIKTRVMEIEAGNGRMLMQLKRLFPDAEFYAINREKTHTFFRRESFILTALKFEIFTTEEIEDIELPYVQFQDLDFGGRIPYDENKFDVIYSQNSISNYKYKFELFNEIMRILRPQGISIHTDIGSLNLYARGVILGLHDALAEIKKRGIDIRSLDSEQTILFKKSSAVRVFPVSPHQPIPKSLNNLSQELRRPGMGYNITY